jgi:hypothetical protein
MELWTSLEAYTVSFCGAACIPSSRTLNPALTLRATARPTKFAIEPPLTMMPLPSAGSPQSSLSQSSTMSSTCVAVDDAIQCPANTLCVLTSRSAMTLTKFVGLGTKE